MLKVYDLTVRSAALTDILNVEPLDPRAGFDLAEIRRQPFYRYACKRKKVAILRNAKQPGATRRLGWYFLGTLLGRSATTGSFIPRSLDGEA